MGNSPHTVSNPSIHILDNDSILHVFHLYRSFLLGEDQDDDTHLWGGNRGWVHRHWWYRLAHVCQRWRSVILDSASYLGISLVCTYGMPVADMLEHSPPLPLVIDFFERGRNITPEDEDGIFLALKQRDRVLRVRFNTPVTNLQEFITAMDEEYPILEYLIIMLPFEDVNTILIFPETLQAPHLHHFRLRGFALRIRSRLLTSAVGLVSLHLVMVHPSTYFHPNTLLQWISLMPHLEKLTIFFKFPIPKRDVERQLTHTPIITLPTLCHLEFHGVSTYLEALVHRITTPRLEKLKVNFFNQLAFSVPCLLQFMNTTENLRFDSARFSFSDKKVDMVVYPHGEREYALGIVVKCCHFDWRVSSMAQMSNPLSQVFSAVEHLNLQRRVRSNSPEEHNEVDRTEWRKFLRPFSSVKTLRIESGLVKELSQCLQLKDEELPLELLPELQELKYYGSASNAITSFINTRRDAGHPITVVHRP